MVSFPSPTPRRIALTLSYDGGPFKGWARQPGLPSIQEVLEDAIALVTRQPVRTVVAGRTDAGVHARGQLVHFDLDEAARSRVRLREGSEALTTTLVRRLNAVMSRTGGGAVWVRSAREVPDGFDARFSALWRSYTYTIADTASEWDPLRRGDTLHHDGPLDVAAMQAEADSLLGLHDFLSYCKPRVGSTTIREVQELLVVRGTDGLIRVHLRADAFCHHMVRTIVGALLRVGSAQRAPGWAAQRLEARVRDASTMMVAGHALVLEEVGYPDDAEAGDRAEETRARRAVE